MQLMRSKRVSITFTIALLLTSVTLIGANAHTALILSDPAVGSKVVVWPTSISLQFDEDLVSIGDEKSNFVVVNNGDGDQISRDDELVSGSQITVSLSPNTVEGPVLVYYRVISADGHPVEGEYTFLYGEQAETAEGVQNEEKSKLPSYLYPALFITSILLFGAYAYKRKKSK
jgi:methionine-rich copper-binding protein CopC